MAFVVLASSAVTFVVVYRRTGSELRRQIDQEIAGDANELTQVLVSSADRAPKQVAERATRYIHAQPFSTSSTLLFAIVAGAPTSSNLLSCSPAVSPTTTRRLPSRLARTNWRPSCKAFTTATRRSTSPIWVICDYWNGAFAYVVALASRSARVSRLRRSPTRREAWRALLSSRASWRSPGRLSRPT